MFGGNLYQGGVLLPNGNVVFVPFNAMVMGIYNPTEDTFTEGPSVGTNRYIGGVLLPNGNVILVPYHTIPNTPVTIRILTTMLHSPPEMCLSPYFNKF